MRQRFTHCLYNSGIQTWNESPAEIDIAYRTRSSELWFFSRIFFIPTFIVAGFFSLCIPLYWGMISCVPKNRKKLRKTLLHYPQVQLVKINLRILKTPKLRHCETIFPTNIVIPTYAIPKNIQKSQFLKHQSVLSTFSLTTRDKKNLPIKKEYKPFSIVRFPSKNRIFSPVDCKDSAIEVNPPNGWPQTGPLPACLALAHCITVNSFWEAFWNSVMFTPLNNFPRSVNFDSEVVITYQLKASVFSGKFREMCY